MSLSTCPSRRSQSLLNSSRDPVRHEGDVAASKTPCRGRRRSRSRRDSRRRSPLPRKKNPLQKKSPAKKRNPSPKKSPVSKSPVKIVPKHSSGHRSLPSRPSAPSKPSRPIGAAPWQNIRPGRSTKYEHSDWEDWIDRESKRVDKSWIEPSWTKTSFTTEHTEEYAEEYTAGDTCAKDCNVS